MPNDLVCLLNSALSHEAPNKKCNLRESFFFYGNFKKDKAKTLVIYGISKKDIRKTFERISTYISNILHKFSEKK